MNSIAKLIIFFIFLFFSIYTSATSKNSENIIRNKIFLFTGVVIFQFIMNLISEFKNKSRRKVNMNKLIKESIEIATTSIIGYSIYIDLIIMNGTKTAMSKYIGTKAKNSLSISCIIIFFVSLLTIFKALSQH